MSHATFKVTVAGLEVPTLIGLDGSTTVDLHSAGKPIPPPLKVKGLLDTGSNVTAVDKSVLTSLGILGFHQTATHTITGTVPVNLYKISLSIIDDTGTGVCFTKPDLTVMELAIVIPGVDALIGLDILLDCRFLLDGPARHFTLEF